MAFKDDFPDYKTYDQSRLKFSEAPDGLVNALEGIVIGAVAGDSGELRSACDKIASLVPCAPTTDRNWDWLAPSFRGLLWKLAEKKFHGFMDFLAWFCVQNRTSEVLDVINEALAEHQVGFQLEINLHAYSGGRARWRLLESTASKPEALLTAEVQLKDVCEQAAEHVRKAREHLENATDVRARKDALRDSLSAMEALVLQLTMTKDIKVGFSTFLNWSGVEKSIAQDGAKVWNRIHELHPDVRHGNPQVTDLPAHEAWYWIERIMLYVLYLQRLHALQSIE